MDPLPPVPPSILPAAAAKAAPGQIQLPRPPQPLKTAFDTPPPDTLAARDTARKLREALAASLKQLATTADLVKAAAGQESLKPFLAHEGITPDHLAAFSKHAGPLVEKFTTPPQPATA